MSEQMTKNGIFPSDEQIMAGPNALADFDFSNLDLTGEIAGATVVKSWPNDFRSGFVCLLGRPNVGKSTLLNAIVGQKIAIMSQRPETTRRAVRGIVTREKGQIVFVDTPGVHRPRTLLGKRINDVVKDTLADVDAVVVCIPADEAVGPGDKRVIAEAFALQVPVLAAVTKTDKVDRGQIIDKLIWVDDIAEFDAIIPVCAYEEQSGKGKEASVGNVEMLISELLEILPAGPPLYPLGDATDEPERVLIAEYVREAALEGVYNELPHSIAVLVEEIERPADKSGNEACKSGVTKVRVEIFVERESQKGIMIGQSGVRLKEVGARARKEIEKLLGTKVYLDLYVRVAKDWQRNPKLLNKLGF